MPLNHKVQPDDHTCTVTCVAMILDVSPLSLLSDFHTPYLKGTVDVKTFLEHKGIVAEYCTTLDRLNDDGIYIVCVASLNVAGGLHNIVLERMGGKNTVYDPNKGREGKRYYTASKFDVSDEAQMFGQYTLDLKIKL